MTDRKRFGILRRVLSFFGLSQQATEKVVQFVQEQSQETRRSAVSDDEFPYERATFLTPAEHEFFKVLRAVVGENGLLFAKVRVKDLIKVRASADQSYYTTYDNKISGKHIDFVVCEPRTLSPLLCIELDDSSHKQPKRAKRDQFLDNAFQAAQLPLLHIPVAHTYNTSEVASKITPYLQNGSRQPVQTPQPAPKPTQSSAPQCPKCGQTMVLRTAQKGNNAGTRFWGCPNFPNCKTIMAYQED